MVVAVSVVATVLDSYFLLGRSSGHHCFAVLSERFVWWVLMVLTPSGMVSVGGRRLCGRSTRRRRAGGRW